MQLEHISLFVAFLLITCPSNYCKLRDSAILATLAIQPKNIEVARDVDIKHNKLINPMINFGFKSFLEINSQSDTEENILISPLSIETALYMSMNGAIDRTFEEMLNALECEGLSRSEINQNYSEFQKVIAMDATAKNSLAIENAVFWDKGGIRVWDPFVRNMNGFYKSEMYDLPRPEFTAEVINKWAEEKTEGRIPKVIDEIEEDEILFILNALYFIGDWSRTFVSKATRVDDFYLETGKTIKVDMMRQENSFKHYSDDELQAVDLSFVDDNYAMTFIQPTGGINQYLARKNFEQLAKLYKRLVCCKFQNEQIILNLPKFELSYKRNISDDLVALGMPRAFDEDYAEFQDLGRAGGNIFISRVIHDTFLKIDENGAEGAAVTTVAFAAESARMTPPLTFTFDKAFLVVLRHKSTGVPIFIGKMMDPSQK